MPAHAISNDDAARDGAAAITEASMSTTAKRALVIGATGGIGGAIAAKLAGTGWQVTALNRDPEGAARRAAHLKEITWVAGDAMDGASVLRAAEGAQLIVHGANPPGYRNWKALALPMLESSIAAASANEARLFFPGTVYNYGPDAGAVVEENAPQNPVTRKGRIRVAMEARLRDSGVRTIILRAGDYFGPGAGNSWFAQGMVSPGKPITAVTYPGAHTVGHAWGYLPDVAEAALQLIAREAELPRFAPFHFGGHWLAPGVAMAEAVRRVVGRPDLPIRPLPWWALRLAAPFNETLREMMEMRYLWQRPLRLANAKLTAFLGHEPHTPLDAAVAATLVALSCLAPAAPGERQSLQAA
jgi:nucleoside-diphosphate-sugar epimerase